MLYAAEKLQMSVAEFDHKALDFLRSLNLGTCQTDLLRVGDIVGLNKDRQLQRTAVNFIRILLGSQSSQSTKFHREVS
ncbi:hypothetical protein ACJIZ3_021072 [Penstemon smallii]|uniref:Uncharacterized protein n=1 Tax=Penstemon smallii TaxID=265156 RepID=A0ABD3SLA6_9LAMI